jgi:predicted dehydrogenase
MIRTYLGESKRFRLNIWDDRLRTNPPASTIHDHPWDFTSYIISGRLLNIAYYVVEVDTNDETSTHQYFRIKTGEGGGPTEDPKFARLTFACAQLYSEGDDYYQSKECVHETQYDRGTVTLNDRSPPTAEYTARVFWPRGQSWVDAVPRPATNAEIKQAVESALDGWTP